MAQEYWDRLDSPLGTLSIVVDAAGQVIRLDLNGRASPGERSAPRCRRAVAQLWEYLAGDRRDFDLELDPAGTDFQRRVWHGLTKIPYGTARSYGELACDIGKPGAARAVGQANGANPIPIIIPCHRVIAADGAIGGYTGGLAVKAHLLALERAALAA